MRFESRFTSRYRSRYQSRFAAGLDGPSGSTGVPQPYIIAPSVTSPADAATDITETPTITSSAFSVANDGSDTHASSDWQIASDSDFNTIVVQTTDDTSNKVSWTVPGGNLSTSTTYYVRVRHTGTTYGDSAWSATISFTTAASFAYSWTNAEGEAFEAQANTTGWTNAFRAAYDAHISNLKSGLTNGTNVWAKSDRVLIPRAPNQSDSLRYLNAPTLTATANGGLTFAAYLGVTGNGSTGWIDSGYNPATNGSQLVQNGALYIAHVRTAGGTGQTVMGVRSSLSNATRLYYASANTYQGTGPHGGSTMTFGANATGLYGIQRSGASAQQAHYNGAEVDTDNGASGSLPNNNVALLAYNIGLISQHSSAQLGYWWAGANLTANERVDLDAACDALFSALEAL